jgi:hypothetical protein
LAEDVIQDRKSIDDVLRQVTVERQRSASHDAQIAELRGKTVKVLRV